MIKKIFATAVLFLCLASSVFSEVFTMTRFIDEVKTFYYEESLEETEEHGKRFKFRKYNRQTKDGKKYQMYWTDKYRIECYKTDTTFQGYTFKTSDGKYRIFWTDTFIYERFNVKHKYPNTPFSLSWLVMIHDTETGKAYIGAYDALTQDQASVFLEIPTLQEGINVFYMWNYIWYMELWHEKYFSARYYFEKIDRFINRRPMGTFWTEGNVAFSVDFSKLVGYKDYVTECLKNTTTEDGMPLLRDGRKVFIDGEWRNLDRDIVYHSENGKYWRTIDSIAVGIEVQWSNTGEGESGWHVYDVDAGIYKKSNVILYNDSENTGKKILEAIKKGYYFCYDCAPPIGGCQLIFEPYGIHYRQDNTHPQCEDDLAISYGTAKYKIE